MAYPKSFGRLDVAGYGNAAVNNGFQPGCYTTALKRIPLVPSTRSWYS
jgi:hypothetical protein